MNQQHEIIFSESWLEFQRLIPTRYREVPPPCPPLCCPHRSRSGIPHTKFPAPVHILSACKRHGTYAITQHLKQFYKAKRKEYMTIF